MMKIKKAFSVVELIIALVITAMLLTALGLVFNGTVNTYSYNQNSVDAYNDGRLALKRISDDIKNAQAVAVSEPVSQCSVITSAGKDITYKYDQTQKKLLYCTNDNQVDSDFVMCSGVESAIFDKNITNYENGTQFVKEVSVVIKVKIGDEVQDLSSSIVVRKNL